jgi:transcriptional regulator with XRE-family HTH domain
VAYPNLKAELARMGVTQGELADAIGCTPETVSRWMNGKGSMPISACFRVKEQLFPYLTVDYLFTSKAEDTRE